MRHRWQGIWVAGAMMLIATFLVAQQAQSTNKRAKPPKFDPAKVSEYFFEDAFAKVIGDRPAPNATGATPTGVTPTKAAPTESTASTSSGEWSKLISATTIEDEIKAIKREVDKNVTTASDF